MPNMSHEEIVQSFLKSKAVDFNALGKFVAEHGSQIVISGRGDYGVRFCWYNIWACFQINPLERFSPTSIAASGIASEVTGGGPSAAR